MRTSAEGAPRDRAASSATAARALRSAVGIAVGAPEAATGRPSTGTTRVPMPTPVRRRNARRSIGGLYASAERGEAELVSGQPLDRHTGALGECGLDVAADDCFAPLGLEVGVVHRRGGFLGELGGAGDGVGVEAGADERCGSGRSFARRGADGAE